MVCNGDADCMVAGGTESSIDAVSVGAFARARALSTRFNSEPSKASRPFDQQRDGFVIGEGAAVLVLEELASALSRGATPIAEIRGYGMSGDASHITAPRSDGSGSLLSMAGALRDASLSPSHVGYINAHATSTQLGDEIELLGIHRLIQGDSVWPNTVSVPRVESPAPSPPERAGPCLVSSTKGATGHLLGAAGAIEAAFTCLALRDATIPPTCNLEDPSPVPGTVSLVGPASLHAPHVHVALTNSFGFGGTNASVCFSRYVE
jgi:3-oxoacyl-[acyl-carrier-protein] synthase II